MQKTQSRTPLISLGSKPAATLKIDGKLITALLISGDHRVTFLISKAMAEAGPGAFTLEYTDSLSAGLERLSSGGLDVLLLDPGVPDSRTLLDSPVWVRAQEMGVPVVVLSARDDETSEIEALKNGAQECLAKAKLVGSLLVRSIYRAVTRQRLVSERERKTQKLESSEARLQNIIKSNPDGIIVVNDGGIVRFVNPAVESLFGCKAEQLLGESLGFLPAVEAGKTELGIVRGDGEKGVAEIQVVKTKYLDEDAYLVSLRDITERKRAEEKAKEETEKVKAASQEAVARAEEEAGLARKEAGKIKTASQKAITRAEEEARLAKDGAEKVKTASQKAVARAEEEAGLAREEAEAAKATSQEAVARAREEARLAREEAEAVEAASHEAVARAREEARLAIKEADKVKTASQEAMARAGEEARIARKEADKVKAASQEAVAKASEEAGLASEEAGAARAASQEAIARAREETRLARKEADKVKTASQKAVAGAEEEAGLARKEAEAARAASQEAIARAEEEMRNLDPMQSEFMSNIVHELRAPLHSILAFTKLILEGKVPDLETQNEFLTIIDSQSEYLRKLVDELVDISPAKSGRFDIRRERIAMNDLLPGVLRELYSVANQKNITIRESIPITLPEMEVDSQRLRQVMFNLLSNAIKFSEEGGSVDVRAETGDGALLVQVTDQGVGIAEEAMPSLFNKFYQAGNPARVGGMGLGLYISKCIIEAHGGHIWAESTEGAGSTFSFTLPLEQANR